MNYFKNKYRVESIRLKNYDYASEGAYFITICIKNRDHFFGEIVNGRLQKNAQSKICRACWFDLPNHYNNCVLDSFVIMPDHVHMIIFIKNHHHETHRGKQGVVVGAGSVVEAGLKPASTGPRVALKPYSISEIIRGFKTFTARKINEYENTPGRQFWQARFYDRIIRNEYELNRIRRYIIDNPKNWEKNHNNSHNKQWSELRESV